MITVGSEELFGKNMESRENAPKKAQRSVCQAGVELRVHMGEALRSLTGGRGSKLTDELYVSQKLCLYLSSQRRMGKEQMSETTVLLRED